MVIFFDLFRKERNNAITHSVKQKMKLLEKDFEGEVTRLS